MSPIQIEMFEDLIFMARMCAVSFSLHYCESNDSWYVEVSSIAPVEEYIGRNKSLSGALADAQEHLSQLMKAKI